MGILEHYAYSFENNLLPLHGKWEKNLHDSENLEDCKVNYGALDERFSHRSAKPIRAVRFRHAPQKM